jgi:hypothetical protein
MHAAHEFCMEIGVGVPSQSEMEVAGKVRDEDADLSDDRARARLQSAK